MGCWENNFGGGREGSYFADFLSTAAVWCVPFCLDCSVPSVYSINFKRKKKGRRVIPVGEGDKGAKSAKKKEKEAETGCFCVFTVLP